MGCGPDTTPDPTSPIPDQSSNTVTEPEELNCASDEFAKHTSTGSFCEKCSPGTSNPNKAPACEPILCEANTSVREHTCVACPEGYVNPAGDDASGPGTWCTKAECVGPYELTSTTVASNPRSIATGMHSTCGIVQSGQVFCIGAGSSGGLGNCLAESSTQTVAVRKLEAAKTISVHENTYCATTDGGEVYCWGSTRYLTPEDKSSTPVKIIAPPNVSSVSVGWAHACLNDDLGRVYCWGENRFGALNTEIDGVIAEPSPVDGLEGAVQVDTGTGHTCALNAEGQVYCWGSNFYGQLGNMGENRSTPTLIEDLPKSTMVATGGFHTCTLSDAGAVYCWGNNDKGQLGNEASKQSNVPTEVQGVNDVITISAGRDNTCAATQQGDVYCWGNNERLQLAVEGLDESSSPQKIRGVTDALKVSIQHNHACATTRDGELYCWGANHASQLGDETTDDSTVPVLMPIKASD